MQLADYLAAEQLTYAEFARQIGSKHARTVERYAKNHQRPNAGMMARVVAATHGAVTPNDFFDFSGRGLATPAPIEAAAAHD